MFGWKTSQKESRFFATCLVVGQFAHVTIDANKWTNATREENKPKPKQQQTKTNLCFDSPALIHFIYSHSLCVRFVSF
jgi:hypothetical protein